MSTLTVIEGAGAERASRPQAETPLESAGKAAKGPQNYRVSKMDAGTPVFLGTIGSRATPETIIASFALTLPLPGQKAEYLLQGLTAMGEVTGNPIMLPISGDSPEVVAARARIVTAAPAKAADGIESETLRLAREMLSKAEALVAQQAAELKVREEKIALAERSIGDKAVAAANAAAAAQTEWWRGQIALQKQEHEQKMSEERDRRAAAVADAERRRKEDIADRDRLDKIAADLRKEEREDAEKRRAEEDARRRDHEKEMATLRAAQTLDNIVPKITAAAAAFGIKGSDIVGRLFAPPESALSGAAAFAAPVSELLQKVTETMGELAQVNMELAARRDGVEVPRRERPPKQIPANAEKREEKSEKEKAERPEPNPKLKDVPRPVIRDARLALRALARELRELEPTEWEMKIMAAVGKEPAIIPYCKAIGVKDACLEAGATDMEATQVAAKAAAFGV